jgi:hypothetical protein
MIRAGVATYGTMEIASADLEIAMACFLCLTHARIKDRSELLGVRHFAPY